jgi:hypothetical protein
MNNSKTSNWDRILQERGSFHPEVEYFMVDYLDANHGAHIRLPFLRREQVFEVFGVLEMAIQGGADLSGIRVLPERFLDEPYANLDIVEDAIAAGVEDAKFLRASTREVLFDWRYEAIAKRFKTKSLAS